MGENPNLRLPHLKAGSGSTIDHLDDHGTTRTHHPYDPAVAPLWFTALVAFVASGLAIGGMILGQRMARTTAAQQISAQDRRDEVVRARHR